MKPLPTCSTAVISRATVATGLPLHYGNLASLTFLTLAQLRMLKLLEVQIGDQITTESLE